MIWQHVLNPETFQQALGVVITIYVSAIFVGMGLLIHFTRSKVR
jgi:hypothetical protein